jgi:hypothetical protein
LTSSVELQVIELLNLLELIVFARDKKYSQYTVLIYHILRNTRSEVKFENLEKITV